MPLPDYPCTTCGRNDWHYANAKNKIVCGGCGAVESWQHPTQEIIIQEEHESQRLKAISDGIPVARPVSEPIRDEVRRQQSKRDRFKELPPDEQLLRYLEAAVKVFDKNRQEIKDDYDYFRIEAIVELVRPAVKRLRMQRKDQKQ